LLNNKKALKGVLFVVINILFKKGIYG
jgi:hypothetical protein